MPRQRSPNRDKAKQLYLNSKGKVLLKEIAEQLDEPDTQIRKWKSLDKWDDELKGNVTKPNGYVTNQAKGTDNHPVKQLLPIELETLANEELTEEQRLFCLYYSKSFNATRAYQKAYDVDYRTAQSNGCRLLTFAYIKDEVMRLKKERCARTLLTKEDIFQKYMDIAFADATDYMSFGQIESQDKNGNPFKTNVVNFKESSEVDGTLIDEVKQGKNGTSIKLPDRMKALQWLSDHMGWATELQQAQLAQIQAQTDRLTGNNAEIEDLAEMDDMIYGENNKEKDDSV